MLANLPMGGFRATNMADGIAASDSATVGQATNLAATIITSAPLKATPIDADSLTLIDSAASNTIKRVTWAVVKSFFQPVNAVLTALAGIGAAVQGDILYGSGAGTWARRAKGTDGQILQLASGLPTWATGPAFTKSFESAQQTITAGGTLTLAHGLGSQPKLYMAVLQCTTGNLGYSTGDEVAINPMLNTTDASVQAISMVPDATNLNVRFGVNSSSLKIMNKGGTGLQDITNSSWRLVVRAWA